MNEREPTLCKDWIDLIPPNPNLLLLHKQRNSQLPHPLALPLPALTLRSEWAFSSGAGVFLRLLSQRGQNGSHLEFGALLLELVPVLLSLSLFDEKRRDRRRSSGRSRKGAKKKIARYPVVFVEAAALRHTQLPPVRSLYQRTKIFLSRQRSVMESGSVLTCVSMCWCICVFS